MENLSGAIAQFFATLSIKVDKNGIESALKTMKSVVEKSNDIVVKVGVKLDTSGIKSQLSKVREQINVTANTVAAKNIPSERIKKVKEDVTRGDLIRAADIHSNMLKDVGPNRLENMLNQADHLKVVMAEMNKGTLDLSQDFKGRLIPTSEALGTSLRKLNGQIELLRTQNLSPRATKNMVSRVQTSSKELESLLPIMGAENAKSMAALANRRLADISALDKAGTKGFEPSKLIFEEVLRKASKTLGDASQGKAQEINRSQYNRTLDRLKEHAAQIKEGLSNLAPSQRSFGARALPQLKANAGVFGKDDQDFIAGYEKLLISQREVAKNNRTINELKRHEHQINRDLAKDDSASSIRQSATFSKRIRELKSLMSNEEALLRKMYEKKYGQGSFRAGSEEAKKFSLSESYLNALPRRGPNTGLLEAQSQDLLNRLVASELSLKDKINGAQQRINSSEIGSIENNKALIELQKSQSRYQEVKNAQLAVASDVSIARYRAEEVALRNQERSLGGFLQRTRTLMTGIRDVANNIFLPFVAFSGARYISDVAAKISSLKVSLEAITGSTAAGAEEFSFLESEAKRLGVTLEGVGKEYVKLVGSTTLSGIDSKVTRDLFTGVSQSAAVFNLNDQEVGRVLTALGQIASKGKVMSEELKGQIAESLPGAFKLAADSMGVTTDVLTQKLKDGALDSKEFLERFSTYLKSSTDDKFKKIENSYAFSLKRLNVAREEFIRSVADNGGEDVFRQLSEFAIYLLQILKPVTAALASAFKGFSKIFFGPLGRAIKRLSDVLGDMFEHAGEGSEAVKKLKAEFASMMVVMTPIIFVFRKFFKALAVFELMVAIWDDLNMYLTTGGGLLGEFMDKLDDPKWREKHPIIDTFMQAHEWLGRLIQSIDDLFKENPDNFLVRAFTDIEDTIKSIIDLITIHIPAAFKSMSGALGFGAEEATDGANKEETTEERRARLKAMATGPSKYPTFKSLIEDTRLGNWAMGKEGPSVNKTIAEHNITVRVDGASKMDENAAKQIGAGVANKIDPNANVNKAAIGALPR